MAGRTSKYETHIQPFFGKIKELLDGGATEKQVAEALGISYPSWNNYKAKYPEFKELCNSPRTKLIEDLRGALVKRALGFTYKETKVYVTKDADGNEKKHTEITEKTALPDTTAIFGALNIYDPEYVKDKKQHELKLQELEVRKMLAESKEW